MSDMIFSYYLLHLKECQEKKGLRLDPQTMGKVKTCFGTVSYYNIGVIFELKKGTSIEVCMRIRGFHHCA